ncbi:hypothetical protein MAPG_09856 [Magnaporthiopsis poae ATCC 64411]|uniref:Uncharacterized protein n=1 Tax=Magnaporthiopsis poae (strain ATCC 64411 / 73-15) TaxID=644358 RepID=A0A0C4EB15_MAGP6|nr:hypothetical protein MAPG_09856 [Magnaporthiopsis poae ATCC 64411]
MQFSTALIAATAAVLASASPIASGPGANIDKQWLVTNWEAGCSRGGCYAYFKVSSPASADGPAAPAFNVTCDPHNEGADYSPCTWNGDEPAAGRSVVSRLLPAIRKDGETTIARFEVSYQYPLADQPNAYYNWTAQGNSTYNQFISRPKTFNIPVTKIFGIA